MIQKLFFAFLILITPACGLLQAGGTGAPEPQSFSFNGVKLIHPSIMDGSTGSTMQQDVYSITGSSRLLLRFEDLLSNAGTISINNKVFANITLASVADVNTAKTSFMVCPVTMNWMMLATWYKAYPMGSSGVWKSEGGDFDSSGCVTAGAVAGTQTLQFDVTSWVVNYVIGRGLNYGLILYSNSSSAIAIDGDNNGSYSPRITWLKN